jgi:hypothetical protein
MPLLLATQYTVQHKTNILPAACRSLSCIPFYMQLVTCKYCVITFVLGIVVQSQGCCQGRAAAAAPASALLL